MLQNDEIFEAALEGNIEKLEAFAMQGVDINITTEDGNTLIILAAQKGKLNAIKWLINNTSIDVHQTNNEGYNALHEATFYGNINVVEFLIENTDLDPNSKATKTGETPIILAAQEGNLNIIKWLINNRGVDVHQTNNEGYNPLYISIINEHIETIEFLIFSGAKIDQNVLAVAYCTIPRYKIPELVELYSRMQAFDLISLYFLSNFYRFIKYIPSLNSNYLKTLQMLTLILKSNEIPEELIEIILATALNLPKEVSIKQECTYALEISNKKIELNSTTNASKNIALDFLRNPINQTQIQPPIEPKIEKNNIKQIREYVNYKVNQLVEYLSVTEITYFVLEQSINNIKHIYRFLKKLITSSKQIATDEDFAAYESMQEFLTFFTSLGKPIPIPATHNPEDIDPDPSYENGPVTNINDPNNEIGIVGYNATNI